MTELNEQRFLLFGDCATQVGLNIDDVQALITLIGRTSVSSVYFYCNKKMPTESLTPCPPYHGDNERKQLCNHRNEVAINNYKPEERARFEKILGVLGGLVKSYKDQMLKDLEALGEGKYMNTDGILRIPQNEDETVCEYRVFVGNKYGVVYGGTFGNDLAAAKAEWLRLKNETGLPKGDDVPVYSEIIAVSSELYPDGEKKFVEFIDLAEDADIQEMVMMKPNTESGNS